MLGWLVPDDSGQGFLPIRLNINPYFTDLSPVPDRALEGAGPLRLIVRKVLASGSKVTPVEKTLDIADFIGIVPPVVKDSLLA